MRKVDRQPNLHGVGRSVGLVDVENSWIEAVNSVKLDDDPTFYNSLGYDVTGAVGCQVLIDIDSTLAPTDIRVLAQFSDDGGTTWWDYEEGLWASLFFEDTDTAAGINKTYTLPVSGHDELRIRLVATGTDATNFFTVTVWLRPFWGQYATAHA